MQSMNVKVISPNLSSALRASSRTATMQRVVLKSASRTARQVAVPSFVSGQRNFARTSAAFKGNQNATTPWEGRHGDDHVLHRDAQDAQSAPSHEARNDKEQGKEGSTAISQKDERNSNQKAKDENPEAPGPVIGMNSGTYYAESKKSDRMLTLNSRTRRKRRVSIN